jgi:hypothetical protein
VGRGCDDTFSRTRISTLFSALLAEAHGKAEQTEEGMNVLAEALTAVDKTGERFYEAELHRLNGELTLQQQFQVTDSRSPLPKPKREGIFSRPLKSLKSNKPNRSNCALR